MNKTIVKCRSCQADIFWWKNPKTGKMTPLDAKTTMIVTEDEVYIKGHQNHFSTCPDADKFRKKKE